MRATSVLNVRVSKVELAVGRLLYPEKVERPRTRGECIDGPRPCPYVGCRHHLYLDVGRGGNSIKFNFPGAEPWDMKHSCAIDVADAVHGDGITLEAVGLVMNMTRERVRQIEDVAVASANAWLRRLVGEEEFTVLLPRRVAEYSGDASLTTS